MIISALGTIDIKIVMGAMNMTLNLNLTKQKLIQYLKFPNQVRMVFW